MRISDWSSYVCSADLRLDVREPEAASMKRLAEIQAVVDVPERVSNALLVPWRRAALQGPQDARDGHAGFHHSGHREHEAAAGGQAIDRPRSEEHTSELQSLMRISYAVFCLKKKKKTKNRT